MRLVCLVLACATAVACTKKNPDFCDAVTPCTDPDAPFCDLAGEFGDANICIPDPRPDGGTRADAGTPDVMVGPPSITVTLEGTGVGSVASDPAGIDCGSTCTSEFSNGEQVTLFATPNVGTTFVTWGGACAEGFEECTLAATGPRTATAHFGLAGEHVVSRAIGGAGTDRGNAVAFDGAGNLVVAGLFSDAVDFGDGNPVTPSGTESFVAKYDEALELVWVEKLAATASAVTVDTNGDVYFTGDTSTGIVLTKFNGADGSRPWTEEVASGGTLEVHGLGIGGSRLVIAGGFEGSVDFGAGDLFAAGYDIYVAWYTPDGSLIRAFDFGGANDDLAFGVDVDDTGAALVGGVIGGATSFGGPTLPFSGSFAGFVVKFTPSGTHDWSRAFASDSISWVPSASYDKKGNVYVTGGFGGNVDFGDGDVSAGAVSAMFIASYSSGDGSYRWAHAAPAMGDYCTMILCLPSRAIPREIAVDPRGRVVVGGEFIGSADFGGGVQASFGGKDVFTAWYNDGDGSYVRSPVFGRMEEPATAQFNLSGRMLAVDRLGYVAITGVLVGNLGFGGPVLEPDGLDAFVVKFGP